MSWFRIDDEWSDSAKVDMMSDAAIRLWSICGTWCCKKRNLHLDGFVPRAALATITKRRWTDEVLEGLILELVEVSKLGGLHEHGLWEPREGGWRFHDWDRYKPKDSDEPIMTPSEAGSLGGRRSAESRKAANGTAQPQKRRSNSEATPKQPERFETASTEAPHRSNPEALEAPDPDPDPVPDQKSAASEARVDTREAAAAAPESRQRPRGQTQAQPSALPPSASDQGQPATHAAPPVPETRPGAFSAPSPRVARAACDLSTVPLNELATVCRENPRNAEFMPVASLDAVQQIHSAWCAAVGRTVRPLGTLTPRNRQLWSILTALESYSLPDILRACEQASKDDWCRGRKPNRDGTPGRPHGIEDMSPTVLRELLDAADSTQVRTSPAVARLIAEMAQRNAS